MPVKQPHPIYLTDDFPRDGCVITIDIQASSYGVGLFAPGGDPHPIEMYSCRTSEALQVLVECLATGKKVPKGYEQIGWAVATPLPAAPADGDEVTRQNSEAAEELLARRRSVEVPKDLIPAERLGLDVPAPARDWDEINCQRDAERQAIRQFSCDRDNE